MKGDPGRVYSNRAPRAIPPTAAKHEPTRACEGYCTPRPDPEVPVADAPAVPVENVVCTVPIFVYGARVFEDRTSPLVGRNKSVKRKRLKLRRALSIAEVQTHGFPEL